MARVSTMVNAISLLWLQGWHAPAGRRTCETPASSQARQIRPAVPVGAMKPGPGRQIVSQDNPSGISRFGGQAGTQAPDPNAPSSQSHGGRAGSITHILPADSARGTAVLDRLRARTGPFTTPIPCRRPTRSSRPTSASCAPDGGLPRQDPAPVGRTGENRGSRNQAGRPRVQAHMMRVCCVIAAAVASVSILVGCSGQSGPHHTVTGLLVRVGGPAPGSPVPLPGTVVAWNAAGEQFTNTTGKNGRFQLSLPPDTYRLTGHSPQVMGDGQQF